MSDGVVVWGGLIHRFPTFSSRQATSTRLTHTPSLLKKAHRPNRARASSRASTITFAAPAVAARYASVHLSSADHLESRSLPLISTGLRGATYERKKAAAVRVASLPCRA